jgi:tRNA pseudouridine38-40 synthase
VRNHIILSKVNNHKINIKLVIEYDGTNYQGWQRQKNAPSIQDVMEKAMEKITQEKVKVIGAGRTDSGVHALNQVAHLHTHSKISTRGFVRGLNSLLPPDIVVKEASDVPIDFHARYSCKSKTYTYHILNRIVPSAIQRNYTWFVPQALHLDPMRRCLDLIVGRRDFKSFQAAGSSVKDSVREVYAISLNKKDDAICVCIEADGFLRHMVRNIVGTLVDVGKSRISLSDFNTVLDSRNRALAGITAPPQGLFLKEVKY